MADKHLSTQFDSELNTVSGRVMAMGGHAEAQIRQAIFALAQFSVCLLYTSPSPRDVEESRMPSSA